MSISVHEMFNRTNSSHMGIQGYQIHKTYVDPLQQIKDRQNLKIKKGQKPRVKATKRGNFIDDQTKLHKIVPGPGQYPFADQWPEKPTLKTKLPDRKTYVDEIMKQGKKEKRPAPGYYNVAPSLKEQEAEVKRLAARKLHYQDRLTFLDNIQFDATHHPGVGNYNPRKRAKTEATLSQTHFKIKPQDWRKKHEILDKKKPIKTPSMTSYTPKPSDYTVFDNLPKSKNKNLLGKLVRFKTSVSGSGIAPARYSVMQEWRGKGNKKLQRHGMQVLSRSVNRSVYYN